MSLAEIKQGFLVPDDLTQLKLIDSAAVRKVAEAIDSAPNNGQRTVVLIATGGTLAMKAEGGVRQPSFDFKQVLAHGNVRLPQGMDVHGLNAFSLDSSQMNYAHTREMAIVVSWLWKNVKKPIAGFVITHGTDTMSYNAAAMSLITGPGLPCSIVFTGAQKPISEPMNDAAANLRNAFYTLESLAANDMAEVVIVMGDKAMLATSAEKIDDIHANAFDAPRHQYVATFNKMEHPVRLAPWLNPRRKVAFEPTIWHGNYGHTLVLKSHLGLSPAMVQQMMAFEETRAVMFYSYGAGTVYEPLLEVVLAEARKRNVPVFIVNPVHGDYRAEYLSSARAIKMGAVPLDMTLSAALAKLEIALRKHPENPQAVSDFMTRNYVGEIATAASKQDR